jgi:hypothetical protein
VARRDIQQARDDRRAAGAATTINTKNRDRERQRQERQWLQRTGGRRRADAVNRGGPSVDIRAEWGAPISVIEMNRISQRIALVPGKTLAVAGSLAPLDRAHERLTARTAIPLQTFPDRTYTRGGDVDPTLASLAAAETTPQTVFVTDSVLTLLMAGSRPQYSWDIVARRVGDQLFFEKRGGEIGAFRGHGVYILY